MGNKKSAARYLTPRGDCNQRTKTLTCQRNYIKKYFTKQCGKIKNKCEFVIDHNKKARIQPLDCTYIHILCL